MLFLFSLLACLPKKEPVTKSSPFDHALPARDFDPPACAADDPRGKSPEHPYEWGAAAAGNSLWFGRLLCADGSIAKVWRVGNIGAAPTKSTSPASGLPSLGPDILDVYMVSCPGQPDAKWITNLYRTQDACVPEGYQVAPYGLYQQLDTINALLEKKQRREASEAGSALVKAYPSYEVSWMFYLFTRPPGEQAPPEMISAYCTQFPTSSPSYHLQGLRDDACKAGTTACCAR